MNARANKWYNSCTLAKTRIAIFILTLIVLTLFGGVAIFYAQGYRLGVDEKNQVTLSPKGLLVINSEPNGAQVFINGELETATNATLSLSPKTYEVEIKKEGYLPWKKQMVIKEEEVTQIDAFLVASAPSLTALTFSGAFNPILSDDNTKIAYGVPVSEDNGEKAGLWVLETVNLPLGFNRDPRQITDLNLADATWKWSPDGRQILLKMSELTAYLLDISQFTPQNQLINVVDQIETIEEEWQLEQEKRLSSKLNGLEDEIQKIFESAAEDIRFSPDESKILYTASANITIPEDIVDPIPGASTQPEERNLTSGKTYVYDIKEDKNFIVGEAGEILSWLPNSLNLLLPKEDGITIMDYDGTNRQKVYSGGFIYPHAYPSTSLNRILILTNFGGGDTSTNLYWLSLK